MIRLEDVFSVSVSGRDSVERVGKPGIGWDDTETARIVERVESGSASVAQRSAREKVLRPVPILMSARRQVGRWNSQHCLKLTRGLSLTALTQPFTFAFAVKIVFVLLLHLH